MKQSLATGNTIEPQDTKSAWMMELADIADLKESASSSISFEKPSILATPSLRALRKRSTQPKNAVSYFALHARVRVARGRPRKCEECGTETAKAYDWANLTGNYADINDYRRLCRSCHVRMDGTITNIRRMRALLNA